MSFTIFTLSEDNIAMKYSDTTEFTVFCLPVREYAFICYDVFPMWEYHIITHHQDFTNITLGGNYQNHIESPSLPVLILWADGNKIITRIVLKIIMGVITNPSETKTVSLCYVIWFICHYYGLLSKKNWRGSPSWASYQISKIAGCVCAGNAGNVLSATAS